MRSHAFRLLNVFAESTFGGNPLCVFEDARGLDETTMQALARQFNLSETTFLFLNPSSSECAGLPPDERVAARVRVFTPAHEMPFAGHPTLGSAHVVRDIAGAGDAFALAFQAGKVPVTASADVWTLQAPGGAQARTEGCAGSPASIAGVFGLEVADLDGPPLWVNTGVRQLLIAVATPEAVRRACPDMHRLDDWPCHGTPRRSAYLFAFDPDRPGTVVARYFFQMQGGGIAEDPGTGSACANLGGWLLSRAARLPLEYAVEQGDAVDRPCRLHLSVTPAHAIRVAGRVIEIGRGAVTL